MRIAPFLALAVIVAAPVSAHPKLVSASPAADAIVASPARLQLNFSEALVARSSGADLSMTQMPGMKMNAPMKVQSTSALGTDGKSLIIVLPRPLGPGVYRLDYHVVSTDTHGAQGSYVFQVR